jgi:hypothetical protein
VGGKQQHVRGNCFAIVDANEFPYLHLVPALATKSLAGRAESASRLAVSEIVVTMPAVIFHRNEDGIHKYDEQDNWGSAFEMKIENR